MTPSPESYRTITLTQGQVAIVDAADYERIAAHRWCAQYNPAMQGFYATRSDPTLGNVLMHREVCNFSSAAIDHKNKNTLDNRRENLRPCTLRENQGNRKLNRNNKSGYKGVVFKGGRWRARVAQKDLGYFDSKEDAARAYNEAAIKHFGEFAHLNVLPV